MKALTGMGRSGKSTILGMFMGELGRSGTSDGDIVHIDSDIDRETLPAEMRTPVMVFRVGDHERFEGAFGKAGGPTDPRRANCIMIGNAVGTVFFRDDGNPVFSVIDRIPLDPETEGVHGFLRRELRESERRKREAEKRSSGSTK